MSIDLDHLRALAAAVLALDHRPGDDMPMSGGDGDHPDVVDYDVLRPMEAAAFALPDAVAEIDRLRAALAEACDALDESPGGVKLADRLRAVTR